MNREEMIAERSTLQNEYQSLGGGEMAPSSKFAKKMDDFLTRAIVAGFSSDRPLEMRHKGGKRSYKF